MLKGFIWLSVHRIHRILYITRTQIIPPQQIGGIETPKNVTIYLPDETAGKMEKYPEVNWSEICRKAIADYIDTRSHIDIAPILEKLKAERNEAYRQGQIFFYQVAPNFDLQQFEILHTRTNTKLLTSKQHNPFGEDRSLSPEAAEKESLIEMRYMTGQFCKKKQIKYPTDATNAFWEGARDALMNIYSKIKPKET